MNKAASAEITWHYQHYTGRAALKDYANGEDFPEDSVIVVGGDLAGMSMANTGGELGGMTVLSDTQMWIGSPTSLTWTRPC